MEKASTNGLTVALTLGTGLRTTWMDMGFIHGLMAAGMKEPIRRIGSMGLVSTPGLMDADMKVNGLMGDSMAWANMSLEMVSSQEKAFGSMGREKSGCD